MNEIKTSPIITQELLNHFVEFEGKVNHFYLDGPGFVTIGIGCVISSIEDAIKLNLKHNYDNLNATVTEKINDYKEVKQSLPGKISSYYAGITKLILPDNNIINLFEFRISHLLSMIKSQIPEYINLPCEAQDVILDMSFNLGVTGLVMKFPRFVTLIKNNDWKSAAGECHRNGISEARNEWTKNKLMSLINEN